MESPQGTLSELGITTEDIFPVAVHEAITEPIMAYVDHTETDQSVVARELLSSYKQSREFDEHPVPKWPGQSMANRVLLQSSLEATVTSAAPDHTPRAPRHRAEPTPLAADQFASTHETPTRRTSVFERITELRQNPSSDARLFNEIRHHPIDASALYDYHLLQTWPDDSAFTPNHQKELEARLNPAPVVTRRQIREQERAAERAKLQESSRVRRIGAHCLRWALSKLENS